MKLKILVGYTGFVGSNLYASGEFDYVYNSKNIEEAYGKNPDLLVYAGLRAEKYLANHEPEKDMATILSAQENIKKINPKKLVLISTIDVLKNPQGVDENEKIDTEGLNAYGYNRYQLEVWVRDNFPDALIIRLPGLFGENIKKNFIYDFINRCPFMLKEEKMEELSKIKSEIKKYYCLQQNGFYKIKELNKDEIKILKEILVDVNFSALNFTDSRNQYQFYPLKRLWKDIKICLENELFLWHPATEPVKTSELYYYLAGEEFCNELNGIPVSYDYKTVYDNLFGGTQGYIMDKTLVLEEIADFVRGKLINE